MDEVRKLLNGPGSPFATHEVLVRGQSMRVYSHAPATLREILDRALLWPDRPAIILGDRRMAFGELHAQSRRLALRLFEEFGLAKGDRIAIAMRNLPEFALVFWSATAGGLIAVPLNARGTANDLSFALGDCGASVVFADSPRVAMLANCSWKDRQLAVIDVESQEFRDLVQVSGKSAGSSSWPDSIHPDDDATIFYTSGTTGMPKGAVATHRAIANNMVSVSVRDARTRLRRNEDLAAKSTAPRTSLVPVPLFHVTGTFSALVPALYHGNAIVLMGKWDADEAMRLMEAQAVNTIVTVPAMARDLAEWRLSHQTAPSSLDTLTYGGAPASPLLVRDLRDAFGGIMLSNGYGMTETCGVVCANSGEDLSFRPLSVGIPVPICDVRISDANGENLPEGVPGRLQVRGVNVVRGYWNRPGETAAAIDRDGWLDTGDVAAIDREGFVTILDRAKDVIIRGGENIHCCEVEDALCEHPAIVETAVVGIPDERLGEIVGALVRIRPGDGLEVSLLNAFLQDRISRHKIPAVFAACTEPLPRNAAGKLDKMAIRQHPGLRGRGADRFGPSIERQTNA